jgi:zinc transporter 1/2/3
MDRVSAAGAVTGVDTGVLARLAAALFLSISSAAGILPPLFASRPASAELQQSSAGLRAFASGVMLALSCTHLLPDAFAELGELSSFPWAGVFIMAGGVGALALDLFAAEASSRQPVSSVHGGKSSDEELEDSPHETQPGFHAHSHAHAAALLQPASKRALTARLLEASVLVHSVIIGADLGVQRGSLQGVASLCLVLAIHQFFEGLALASVIADSSALSFQHKVRVAAAFILTLPGGVVLGVIASERGAGESNGVAGSLLSGTLNGICAGMLLQMSTSLIREEFEAVGCGQRALKTRMFGLLVLGCASMAGLAVWA